MSSEGSSEASEAYESESDEESLPELSPASLPPACSCSSMWKPELVVAEAFDDSPCRLMCLEFLEEALDIDVLFRNLQVGRRWRGRL